MDESVRHGNPNPLLTANLFSKLSFWWLSALLKKGSKGWLEESDMYNVCPIDSSEDSGAKLEAAWNKELEQQKKGKQPSFLRALFRTFGAQYLPFLFLGLFEELVRIGQPLLLAQLLDYFTTDSTTSKSEAWLYATGLVLCFITQTISHHTLFFATTRIGMRVRVSSCSLIYRKSLRLSNKSLTECSVGQIVNMMSNDVAKYDTGMMFFLYLVVGPIQCLAAVIYLWYLLGPAVLAALMLMILLMPAQIIYGKLLFNRRQKFVVHTDRRVKVMNEIISGVRIIKLYCWEKPFGSIVEILRRLEIKHLRRIRHVQCFHIGPYYAMAQFSIFFFILVLVLIGRERDIDPGTVFMLLGMLETFRLSLGMFIPVAASSLAEVLVVVSRMQKFLLLEEISKVTDSKLPQACVEKSVIDMGYKNRPGYSVKITNLTAKWDTVGETADTLENVSLTLEHGRFVAVIGPVGAGKTSLLMSILGELPPRTGAVDARGKIAFVSQHPWIFSGSLRQNILFGEKMDTPRYDKIIKICALSRDLSILPKGDATLIGDRGVNLSGGQKARVSLARALYMDADVYLLDDPLAAVDTTVGKHIFHKCIMGYLENKPRILVTHQIQLLPNADNIVILTNGQIMSQGTYTELSKSGVDFSELLKPPEEDSAEKDGYNQKVIDYQNQSKSSEVKDKRRLSVISQDSVGDAYVPDSVQLPEEEERETGSIDREVFLAYFKAAAHIPLFVAMSISFIAAQVAYVGSYWWLARWTDATADRDSALNAQNQNRTDMGRTLNYTHTHIPEVDTYFNLYIYIGIIIALFILFLGRAFLFFEFAVKAGENLHNMIFVRILRTAMVFFDTNPVGRILNRFSKDTGQIDDLLPWSMFDCFQSGLSCASIVIVACIVNPWVFIPVIPLMVVFVIVRNYYAKTSRSVKRLEGTTHSPVFSHLSATLQGLHTIRAMNMEQRLTTEFDSHQDLHTEAWFLYISISRWLGIRLDLLSTIFGICVVYFSILVSDTMDPGFVGLSIVYAMNLMNQFQWSVRQTVDTETQMVSVERVLQYTRLPIEADLESKPDQKPPHTWPSSGSLQAKGLSLRYSPSAPLVLKDINFDIRGGEKIGIVGRTGAGKSSLITALFRLAEPEGDITIDGASIHSLGLHDLRRVISIIPQDLVLFTGAVRRNLDPFEEYSDSQIWRALDKVQLKEAISSHPDNLYMEVTEGGSNFSAGQRQLMCLARAVLGNTRILVIDEATANVDPITDELIQQTIRTKFKTCTVLTIAHRLHTIIDCDRIMVLDAGKLVEVGSPKDLLSFGKNGWFYCMVEQLGKSELELLTELASRVQEAPSSKLSPLPLNGTNHLSPAAVPEKMESETTCFPEDNILIATDTREKVGCQNKAFTLDSTRL